MIFGENRAVLAAALAIGVAAIVAGVLTRTNDPLARAHSLDQVVAQVRTGFGDYRIVRAGDHGSTLSVEIAGPATGYGVALIKGQFEAQVLAAAVAEWQRLHGRDPITKLITADSRGDRLGNYFGDPVPGGSDLSSVRSGECESLARRAVASKRINAIARTQPPLTLTSVTMLPYLHGTCVFRFRTEELVAGFTASVGVFGHISVGLGDTNERPRFFELDDQNGRPVDAFSWMPGLNGSSWARRGVPYPFAHG